MGRNANKLCGSSYRTRGVSLAAIVVLTTVLCTFAGISEASDASRHGFRWFLFDSTSGPEYVQAEKDLALDKATTHTMQPSSTTMHHTTEKTTNPHTTEKTTKLHTTEKTTKPHTTEKTTKPHTTEKTTKPHTTEKTTKLHTTEKTTKPHTTEKTTKPHTTEKTTKPHTTVKHTTEKPSTTGKPAQNSILDVLTNLKLTSLLKLVNQAKLDALLDDVGNYTVFAPSNDAVDKFLEEFEHRHDSNKQPDDDLVKALVLNHVIAGGVYNSTQVVGHAGPFNSAAKGSLFVNVLKAGRGTDTVLVNGQAVVDPDHAAGNGIVHVMDGVIFPIGDVTALRRIEDGILTTVLSTFLFGLDDILSSLSNTTGVLTVFVPLNQAWTYLPFAYVEKLLNDPKELSEVILHHVVAGSPEPTYLARLTGKVELTPVTGGKLTVDVEDDGKGNRVITVNKGSKVVWSDDTVENGVFHFVDRIVS